jgi:hypothetical protein
MPVGSDAAGASVLNLRRILAFVGILFTATAAAAFPFGFIRGYSLGSGHVPPSWLGFGQALAVPIVAIVVIAVLARRQLVRTWEHALMVVLGAWLLSFPVNVMLFGQPWLAWLRGVIVLCVVVALGVPLGVYLRRFSSKPPAP